MRHFTLLAAIMASAAVVAAARTCPVLDTQVKLRKNVAGGKTVTLRVKITNRGNTVANGGLALRLPPSVAYNSIDIKPMLSPAPTFRKRDTVVSWTGIDMPRDEARTFRIKLAFDKCAGTFSKDIKKKMAAFITMAFFTGDDEFPDCLNTTSIAVNIRRTKKATNCLPLLCALPTSAEGQTFYGCQTAAGSGVLGEYTICTVPDDVFLAVGTVQECISRCTAAVPGLAAVELADTNGGDCFCYGPGFLTWTELVNNSDLSVPKNVYYREAWKEAPPTGSC